MDNSRLSVDKCLSLWRSPHQVENTVQTVPPYMGAMLSYLQDVDLMRKRPNLWKNLWVSSPESFHRQGFSWLQKNPISSLSQLSVSHLYGRFMVIHTIHTPYYDYYT